MSTYLGHVSTVKKGLSMTVKKLLYLAFIQPHLDYCSAVLAECSKQETTKLDKIQKEWHENNFKGDLGLSICQYVGLMTLGNRMYDLMF